MVSCNIWLRVSLCLLLLLLLILQALLFFLAKTLGFRLSRVACLHLPLTDTWDKTCKKEHDSSFHAANAAPQFALNGIRSITTCLSSRGVLTSSTLCGLIRWPP
jgi:hypothetical protein